MEYAEVVTTNPYSLSICSYGCYTGARGDSSLAFGNSQMATEDWGTFADGDNSIAGGLSAQAVHDQSQAFGNTTRTGKDNQMVIGCYNTVDDTAYFVIGDGDTSQGPETTGYERIGTRNCFTVGNDGTADYFTLGSKKITHSDFDKIEQHSTMLNYIKSSAKNGSISLSPKTSGSTIYIGTHTITVAGIVTGYTNLGEGSVTIKNTGTSATITITFSKNQATDYDYINGNYNVSYYYIPIN